MTERSGAAAPEALVALAVALLAVLVYLPSIRSGFTDWDDPEYVISEPVIRSLAPGNFRELARPRFGNWAPFNTLSYAIDYKAWGLRASGFHLTNVLLHAGSAALLALILSVLGAPLVVGGAAAALFALHPAQVESVAWISQRKSTLSMLFLLLSFLVYVRATKGERVSQGGLVGAFLLYLGALLAKVSVVAYPGILLLYDLGYRRESLSRIVLEKLPFLAAAMGVAWVNYTLQAQARMTSEGWIGGSPVLHAATIAELFARYFRILFLPVNLSALYAPPDAASPLEPLALAGFALLAAGAAGFAIAWRRDRRLLVWLGFFWLGFLPVAQLVGFNLRMADRYLYIPSIGFAVLLAHGGWGLHRRLPPGVSRRALEALAISAFACLLLLTVARERVWRDPRALWSATVRREPVAWMALYNYGKVLEREGDDVSAIASYERAVETNPRSNWSLINLGVIHARRGEPGKAETYLRRAMDERFAADPGKRALAATNLGLILEGRGDARGALSAFQTAALLAPLDPEPQILLARALRKSGKLREARMRLDALLARDPPPAIKARIRAERAAIAE